MIGLRNYVGRDLPQLGLSANPVQVQRLLSMLSKQQGGLLNQSALANALQVRNPVLSTYLNFLEQAFLIRRLTPYYTNIAKRLTKTLKLCLRDSGVLHQYFGALW